jgi:hypothetical protein
MTGTRSDRLLCHLGHFASRHSNQIIAAIYIVLAVLIAASALIDMAAAQESPPELSSMTALTGGLNDASAPACPIRPHVEQWRYD